MTQFFDVAVVGASLAGSALALQLARAGNSVLLLDKSEFHRRKACGEGLSARGIQELKTLGLSKALAQIPTHPFFGYVIKGPKQDIPIISKESYGTGIQRVLLDNVVRSTALAEPSLQSVLGRKIDNLEMRNNFAKLSIGQHQYKVRYLVGADGVHSPLARGLDIPERKMSRTRAGVSLSLIGRYLSPWKTVTISLHNSPELNGFEIIGTPVAEDRINLCVLTTSPNVRSLTQFDEIKKLLELTKNHLGFEGDIDGEVLGMTGIAGIRRQASKDNVLLIGDACETMDPIGGMGMTHALVSARLAATTLNEALAEKSSDRRLLAAYAENREKSARLFRGFTRLTYFGLKKIPNKQTLALMNRLKISSGVSRAINDISGQASLLAQLALYVTGMW